MFKKIPKEDWFKLSQEERDFFIFEFNKDVERRRVITLVSTRALALVCIFVLFWVGFVQFQAIKNYDEVIDKYGNNGYCYLCGEKTLKVCDCQYFTDDFVIENRERFKNYSNVVAEYNSKGCSSLKVVENEMFNKFLVPLNFSLDIYP